MNLKTKNRLIQAARRISMGWAPRVAAKQKCKVDKALYQCQLCKVLVYEGKSPVTFQYYSEIYPSVVMDKFHMDHRSPVIPVEGLGFAENFDWITYYKRLFCPEENWDGICLLCHTKKTKTENAQRKLHKGKKK